MLVLISHAKMMSEVSRINIPDKTKPLFIKEAKEIALNMAQYSPEELVRILKINSKLAVENYLRFKNFLSTEPPTLQAIAAYTGVVFKNMAPENFTAEDFAFAQKSLRILSFTYGVLRPLDMIKPYRMEYDIRLPELGDGNMYSYWRDKLTPMFIKEVKSMGGDLVFLGSHDIQPTFNWKKIEQSVRVITPDFKVWKNGKLQTIVIYAKMARGQMCRHMIKNRIQNPEDLKSFSWEGFAYDESLSSENNWVFIQE